MPVVGGDVVAKNIVKFGDGFKKHVFKVMDAAGQILDKEITGNMSLTDHSLEDLADLGHPYGHGPRENKPLHDPNWMVHKQTGLLLESKKRGTTPVDITGGKLSVSAYVGLDETVAKYAPAVIYGTSRMIPRDFLSGSLNDPGFKEQALGYIHSNLRDMVINFKGVETHA